MGMDGHKGESDIKETEKNSITIFSQPFILVPFSGV